MQYLLTQEELDKLALKKDLDLRDEALELARRIIVQLSGMHCGAETSDKFGIAIWEDVIVPDDYEGEWGGSPVCERCFYLTRGMQEQNPGKALAFAQVKRLIKANTRGEIECRQ